MLPAGFWLDQETKEVKVKIKPQANETFSLEELREALSKSQFSGCVFSESLAQEGVDEVIAQCDARSTPATSPTPDAASDSSSPEQSDEADEEAPAPAKPVELKDTVEFTVGQVADAIMVINISTDQMEATLQVTSARGVPNPDFPALRENLTENEVTFGIKEDALKQLLAEVEQSEPGTESSAVVAVGTEPSDGTPSEFEWLETPIQDREIKPKLNEDGSVDMRELSQIITIDPDTPLMKRIPAQKGEAGHNVLGMVIPAQTPEDIPFSIAGGAVVSDKDPHLLVSARRGVLMRSDHGVLVEEALILPEVSIQTGNVHYDGSVIVKGDVREGMEIEASSDVFVEGIVESARIRAGGSIEIKGGVVGKIRDKHESLKEPESYASRIHARKGILLGYGQQSCIDTSGILEIQHQLMNCLVTDCREIISGQNDRKAKIMGGYMRVRRQVQGAIIGAESYVPTVFDFSRSVSLMQERLKQLQQKVQSLSKQKKGLAKVLANNRASGQANPEDETIQKIIGTIKHIDKSLEKLESRSSSLRKKKQTIQRVIKVKASVKLYPGVQIVFGEQKHRLRREYQTMTISLGDKGLIAT